MDEKKEQYEKNASEQGYLLNSLARKTVWSDIKLHREDFSLNKTINERGERVIDIRLENYRSGFSEYSPRQDLRIDSNLYNYIISEHTSKKHPVHFNIYSEVLKNKIKAQELFSKVLHNALTAERVEVYSQWRNALLQGFLFLIISISVIVGSQFIPLNDALTSIIARLLDIFAWVFGWGATEKILLQAPKLRREHLHLARLANAKITFFDYPDNRWFEQGAIPK